MTSPWDPHHDESPSPVDPSPVDPAGVESDAVIEPWAVGPSVPASEPERTSGWVVPAPRDRPGPPSTFRTAFLAALLSATLTAAASFAIFTITRPASPATASPTDAAAVPTVATGPSTGGVGSAVSVTRIVAASIPFVVTITTSTGSGGFGQVQGTGVGSGIIFDAHGWILTNAHVVAGADAITVQLSDGRTFAGQVYGTASSTDLAIVKVDALGLPTAPIGESKGVAPGDAIIAIGDPLGEYPQSVTTGVVSGLGRSIDIRGSGTIDGLIQTDAAINPGDSGGPLIDAAGRVIGVTTATAGRAQGISFAIPIDVARPFMAAALAGKPID